MGGRTRHDCGRQAGDRRRGLREGRRDGHRADAGDRSDAHLRDRAVEWRHLRESAGLRCVGPVRRRRPGHRRHRDEARANCHPPAPVAVVGVQGVNDPVVPFAGGEVGRSTPGSAGGSVESSRATQELWRSIDGCGPTPTATPMHASVQDGTTVTRRAYPDCRADVVWYEIAGGGHRWPPHHAQGVAETLARRTLGVSSQNIDASETIWAFFAAHPRTRNR